MCVAAFFILLLHRRAGAAMKISPFHMELAKKVADGKKYKEISQEIQISQSRLSVLKSNPLFQKYVRKYQNMKDDGYAQAARVLDKGAQDAATEVLRMATSLTTEPRIRLDAAKEVLDRAGMGSVGSSKKNALGGDEVSFEQILRITKKKSGTAQEDDREDDYESAFAELSQDTMIAEPLENVTPASEPPDLAA